MVILFGGGGGTAVYVIYKLVHRPDRQPFPSKHHFEAKVGKVNQNIVADKAIADLALCLRVVKDEGKQELVAEDPVIQEG